MIRRSKMLINFSVENWMSFDKKVTLSMVAGEGSEHGERVPETDNPLVKILPIGAIFGGNASGKSNICKALRFCRRMVVDYVKRDAQIEVVPFRLNAKRAKEPTSFWLEILIGEEVFEFSFSVNGKIVIEEKLAKIETDGEMVLYHRRENAIKFNGDLPDIARLNFVYEGTWENQLFLFNSVSQNADQFRDVHDWFSDCLEFIGPDSMVTPFIPPGSGMAKTRLDKALDLLDAGIDRLGSRPPRFGHINLPVGVKKWLARNDLPGGKSWLVTRAPGTGTVRLSRKDGEMVAEELTASHIVDDGQEIRFDLDGESGGAKRLIRILPAFLELASRGSAKVCVIDGLGDGLHSLLVRALVEDYLGTCDSKTRSQLVFTTHDSLLIDRQVLRTDEMWVMERNSEGATDLYSLGDYKGIEREKDIHKSYLLGRYGGIPRLVNGGLSVQDDD
jgi:AAA15 family ATPase/GTPase